MFFENTRLSPTACCKSHLLSSSSFRHLSNSSLVFANSSFVLSLRGATSGPPVPALNSRLNRLVVPRLEVVDEPYSWSLASSDLLVGFGL